MLQVILVIFRNLLILVNLVISGILSDSSESYGSGDSGAYMVIVVIQAILLNLLIHSNMVLLVILIRMVILLIMLVLVILVNLVTQLNFAILVNLVNQQLWSFW